jgi:hypothetical protein
MKWNGAAEKSHARSENQDDDEDKDGRLGSHAKDFFAEEAGEEYAEGVTDSAADEGEQELFGGEKKTDGAGASADGFH